VSIRHRWRPRVGVTKDRIGRHGKIDHRLAN
jgi:hypothetical protein